MSHYIGWAPDTCPDGAKFGLEERIKRHRHNIGARLLKNANNAQVGWKVVRTWEGRTLADERELKRWKNSKKICPLCWASNPDNLEIGNPVFGSSDFVGLKKPKFFNQ